MQNLRHHGPCPPLATLSNLRARPPFNPTMMMMTTIPTSLLQSPKLSSAMNSLSVKRPRISPLKRKLSEDEGETPSPTSTDDLEQVDESVISPKKKTKLTADSSGCSWTGALVLDELVESEDGSDEACMKVLSAYTPVAFDAEPAEDLDDEEREIFAFFLS